MLTPLDGTWWVRTTEGAVVGVRIDGYYSSSGDSGWFTLTWRPL